MKKSLSIVLSAILSVSMLAGCAGMPVAVKQASENQEGSIELLDLKKNGLKRDISAKMSSDVQNDFSIAKRTVYGRNSGGNVNASEQFTINNVDYVMIYNPFIFDMEDTDSNSDLYSGDFSSQISIDTGRAGSMPPEMELHYFEDPVRPEIDIEKGGRSGGLYELFDVGDTSAFFYSPDANSAYRMLDDFTCIYVGDECYIWSLNDAISSEDAAIFGEELDELIFYNDSHAFGTPRFTDGDGKVNVLFYPMNQEGLCGYFDLYDNFAWGEVSLQDIANYGLNTDRAIIHINSKIASEYQSTCATLAHELQHQINCSNAMENPEGTMMCSWLNESLSAYAEELNYPGIKKQSNENMTFYLSENYKYGQSLYNFYYANDCYYYGAYGAVYLYEEFLRHYNGDDVTKRISDYWRTACYEDLTANKVIYNSVTDSFRTEIDEGLTYPEEISSDFYCMEDEWMSKLTLNFYLETLTKDLADVYDYNEDFRFYSVYDELASTEIEGGGRIIVATKDGSYTVPADASPDLIYVGLDSELNPVTGFITTYEPNEAIQNTPTAESEPEDASDTEIGGTEEISTETAEIEDVYIGDSSIDFDENGYFEFDFNLKPTSYFFYNSSVSEDVVDKIASGYESIDGVVTQKVTCYSLTDVNLGLKQIVDNRQDVGFVTVLMPQNITSNEWASFVELSEELICKGIFVTLYSYGEPECYPYPWNIVFCCDDVASGTDYFSDQLGEVMVDDLMSICADGEPSPKIYDVK